MSVWLVRRVAQALVTFLLAATLAFFLMRLTPGDPLARLTEDRPVSPETLRALRARYGVDRPLVAQFSAFLGGVIRGDLGQSISHNGREVTELIRSRLPATLLLGGTALLLNFLFGIAIGVFQATRAGTGPDRALTLISLAAYATPSFWLALILQWGLGTELHWLPVAFMQEPWLAGRPWSLAGALDVFRHLVLPALSLALVTFGATARYQRAAMLDALALDCIRTARTKGLPERAVRWRHAWRNALGPMLTLFGLWLPLLVAGSLYVEAVFAWPGLGTLAAEAIAYRDYPVIMGTTILVSGVVVLGNLAADLAHRWLDPRLRTP
ncbi:MAG TPA: ABC transporter permease [Gemmatimonadales bacterium]